MSSAVKTEGYSGADILGVCETATMFAIRRYLDGHKDEDESSPSAKERMKQELFVKKVDFDEALKRVRPYSMKDLFYAQKSGPGLEERPRHERNQLVNHQEAQR